MNADKSVGARFQRTFGVVVNVSGPGHVTLTPNKDRYSQGDSVVIEAVPDSGFGFAGWSGAISGLIGKTNLLMNEDKSLTASFKILHSIQTSVDGSGTITIKGGTNSFLEGSLAQITATASLGWQFVGWRGSSTSTNATLSLTMDADKQATAVFKQLFTLTSSVQGQGTILVDPQQTTYLEGSVVTLKAAAATNYQFVYWIGNVANSNSATTTTILSTNRFVTAVFLPYYRLDTVATNGGAITRSPDQTNYLAGATVALTAVPDDYHTFSNWSGSVTGTNNPISFSMDKSKTVIASFVSNYFLTIITNGQGIVERSPIKNRYAQGEQVRLTASPLAGYGFGGWSGALSGTNAVAYLAMNADKSVTASFKPLRTLQIDIDGSGSVAQDPYLTQYLDGSTVQLTAAPTNGWQFVSCWGASPAAITR